MSIEELIMDFEKNNNVLVYYRDVTLKENLKAHETLKGKALRRMNTKVYFSEGILYSAHIMNWLFSASIVGKSLHRDYDEFMNKIVENILLSTTKQDFLLDEVYAMLINTSTKEVSLILNDGKTYPMCYSNSDRNEIIKTSNISKIEISIADVVNDSIMRHKKDFKALPDMMNVLKHIYPDKKLNTSIEFKEEILDVLKQLPKNDEDLVLLTNMAPDLLSDLKTIFSDIEIYWG